MNLTRKRLAFICCGVSSALACIFFWYRSVNRDRVISNGVDRAPMVRVANARIMPICRFLKLTGILTPSNSVEIKAEVDSTVVGVHFSEGGTVKRGDLLVQLDDSRALAALKEAEAQCEKIRSEYKPSAELAEKGVISKVRRDTLKAELSAAEARVASCKVVLEKHRIVAPFSGKVGLKEISEGQFVNVGYVLAKLVDDEALRVDFKVPDVNIAEVYSGQKVDVSVDGNENSYSATVTAIDPESDKMSHSFNVRAVLEQKSGNALKPGMFVKVGVALDRCKNGIVIPEGAIERYGEIESVFRVLSDGTAVRTNITSGYRNKGVVEILSGLNESDTVVMEGGARVVEGKKVQIVTDEMIIAYRKKQKELAKKKAGLQKQSEPSTNVKR